MNKFNNDLSEILISVIIPAYNVEEYIEKCIYSILDQTYKNIEVIVINDGSTDNTGNLINNILGSNDRGIVIHKSNSGVSAARNSGIEVSSGEYLIFVDGDDFISPDLVEYMLHLVNSTKSDFCLSTSCFTMTGEKQTKKEFIKKIYSEDATVLLLSPDVMVGCWNKIYKRELIVNNKIWFSTELFYGEGLSFITRVSQISKSIGVGNRKVYYYRRNNENSATTKFDISKIYNGEKSLSKIKDSLILKTSRIINMHDLHLSIYSLGAIVKLKQNKLDKKYKSDYKRWRSFIRKKYLKLIFIQEITIYRKLLLFAGILSPWLVMKLDYMRRKRIFNKSVPS